ncbi:MAG: DNRLRE domain-containing protein, partial [Thermoanaerobaculales bacterium]|nr:DNRLRE domain-containing protein [Thermoanaerobaculales bacterium]
IDRTRGILHVVWAQKFTADAGTSSLTYTRCKDLSNWNVATSWYQINGSTNGYNYAFTEKSPEYPHAYFNATPIYAHSIAVDSSGNPHVAFIYKSGSYCLPYYIYGTSSWQTPISLADTTTVNHRYPTVEVDSNDVVHYAWSEYVSSAPAGYRRVYHKSASSPYTSFSSPADLIVEVGTDPILNLSMAADDQGNVHLTCENEAQSNICGAYYNGSTWTEYEAIDTLGWDKPVVGARLGTSGAGHVIISPRNTGDPDDVYYWTWSGSAWNQPETDTTEITDSFVSLEKNVPSAAGDIGFLFFDEGSTTSDVYFSRILFEEVFLESPDAGQVSDAFDTDSSENDASLLRFQMRNTTGSSVTVNQVVLQLSGISDISSSDISDLRLNDGTSNVGGTPTVSIPDSTGTITFSTPFSLAAGSPVTYTLIGDVANLLGGDTLSITVATGDITIDGITVAGISQPAATHTADYEIELQVEASNDDSFTDSADNTTANNAQLYIQVRSNTSSSRYYGGIRFSGISIPQGALINRATLTVRMYTSSSTYDDINCTVHAHDTDDAPDFADDTTILARPMTTGVPWVVANAGLTWQSIDVASEIQAIVDRGGWSSGNALALLLIGKSDYSAFARFASYDYSSGAYRPRLSIDWSINQTPGAPTTPYSNDNTAQSGATNPSGITDPTPAFSAVYNDPDSGDIANKYRVEVNTTSDFTGTVMWDSGAAGTSMTDTTEGNRCPDIIYAG